MGGKTNNGYQHSLQTKTKISNSLKGKKHTEERKNKERLSAIKVWENPNHKLKMSLAHVGKRSGKDHPLSKQVYQYSIDKILLNIFDSVGEAERITKINHRQISDCCNGKQKTCHGFIWSY